MRRHFLAFYKVAKYRGNAPLTFRMPQHTSSEVTAGNNTIGFKCSRETLEPN